MSTVFNDNFREFIQTLNDNQVEYMLVGGYALILHGYRRVTGDMDIWVNRTKGNYSKLVKTFSQFGLSVFDMTEEKFPGCSIGGCIFFWAPTCKHRHLTKLKGVDFDDAFSRAMQFDENGLIVRFIHLNHLIDAKKASGRYKDLDDIEKLSPGTDL